MAVPLAEYKPALLADIILDGGTQRVASKDFYDVSGNYYKGSLVEIPGIQKALSDLYYGVEETTSVTLKIANAESNVDSTWDEIILGGDEPRGREVLIQRNDPLDGTSFELRGKITEYKLGPTVEITVETRRDYALDTLLPQAVVTNDAPWTVTAIDIGKAVNLCFGHCRNVPLRNINNDRGNDIYDYLIGYGIIENLWIDHANGLGIKRDGVLVNTTEYGTNAPDYNNGTVFDGSQAAPYPGYAFIRFTREQMSFTGAFHNLTADVKGLMPGVLKILDDCGDTSDIEDWVESSDGLNPADETTLVKQGNHSMALGIDADKHGDDYGAWVNSQVQGDLSAYQHDWIYFWAYFSTLDYLVAAGKAFEYNIGNDLTHRLEFDFTKSDLSVGWNLLKCDLDNPSVSVGIVDWSAIDWQIILIYEVAANTDDFTVYVDPIMFVDHGDGPRNFAAIIRGILSNTTWGLSESVDAASFATAAAALPTATYMCDGAITEQRKSRDVLNDLLFPSRATLTRATDGEWEMDVDVAGASILNLGDNDGYYNNAQVVNASAMNAEEALHTAVVHYAINSVDPDIPFKEISHPTGLSFGITRTYDLPFVSEDDTAKKVLSYLTRRSVYSDKTVLLQGGMECRDISCGNVITLTAPAREISAKEYKVERISKGVTSFELACREYSADIYGDEAIVAPTGQTSTVITVQGPVAIVGDTTLGDGSDQVGTITLTSTPDKGDIYIGAGKTDFTTAQNGFILGIDDSDADKVKFYLGDATDYLYWNGANLVLSGNITAAAGTIGGWTITTGYIYSLQGGTPTAAPGDGIVLASGNEALIVYEDVAKRVEVGYLSPGVYGIKGYATDGATILFEISDTQQRLGGFYFSQNDLWGGNAAIGNVATTVVIGNLDGTSKIALGPTADAITVAGAQTGFIVDGGGNLRVGDANSWLKWSGGALGIQLASGESITVSAGGDIHLIGNDANPALLYFQGDTFQLDIGFNTTGNEFGFYPQTDNAIKVKFGGTWVGSNFLDEFWVSTRDLIRMDVWRDSDYMAGYDIYDGGTSVYHKWSTEWNGNDVDITFLQTATYTRFLPNITDVIHLGVTDYRWKTGWFTDLTVTNCITEGTCEIIPGDALAIIGDIIQPGSGIFNEFGHERFDMKRLQPKYPYIFVHDEEVDEYREKIGTKSDLLYTAVMQLDQRVKDLEGAKSL